MKVIGQAVLGVNDSDGASGFIEINAQSDWASGSRYK